MPNVLWRPPHIVIGEPCYFPQEKLRETGRVVRAICLLRAPIEGTDGADMPERHREGKPSPANWSDGFCAVTQDTQVPLRDGSQLLCTHAAQRCGHARCCTQWEVALDCLGKLAAK